MQKPLVKAAQKLQKLTTVNGGCNRGTGGGGHGRGLTLSSSVTCTIERWQPLTPAPLPSLLPPAPPPYSCCPHLLNNKYPAVRRKQDSLPPPSSLPPPLEHRIPRRAQEAGQSLGRQPVPRQRVDGTGEPAPAMLQAVRVSRVLHLHDFPVCIMKQSTPPYLLHTSTHSCTMARGASSGPPHLLHTSIPPPHAPVRSPRTASSGPRHAEPYQRRPRTHGPRLRNKVKGGRCMAWFGVCVLGGGGGSC